jgi:hypothetical protein
MKQVNGKEPVRPKRHINNLDMDFKEGIFIIWDIFMRVAE